MPFMGSQGKNAEVVCHSLLQWTAFCQDSPPWPIHFSSLIPKMSMFTLAISCLTTSNLTTLIHGPNILGSYTISTVPYSFGLYFHHQIQPQLGIISALAQSLHLSVAISSFLILGTYWIGEFIFQCHIFLPFHTVHGVLKERILKWFTIPFSSGPHFVRTLHPSKIIHPSWVSL